jgi:hypothetical protein
MEEPYAHFCNRNPRGSIEEVRRGTHRIIQSSQHTNISAHVCTHTATHDADNLSRPNSNKRRPECGRPHIAARNAA